LPLAVIGHISMILIRNCNGNGPSLPSVIFQ
jgi:hypothetical protein